MNIGIDIDDTICNSWDNLIDEICNDFKLEKRKVIKSKKIYNNLLQLKTKDYHNYAKEKFMKLLYNPKLKPQVKEVIDELKKENKIIFITARTDYCYIDAYNFTKNYLDKNNIYYDKIIVGKIKKAKTCIEENIDVFIDDSIKNCMEVNKCNIKTILFENYYNEDCNIFIKAKNWNQILTIIGGINEKK